MPETWFARVAWLPDSSGCYFPTGDFMEAKPRDLCFLRPGDDAPLRESLAGVAFESASPEAPAGYPQVSADGRWLTLASERFGGRIALARRLPDGEWFQVLEDTMTGRAYGFVDGDDYVAVVTEGAPRGRLVRLPLQTARDRATWVEVVPESDEVLVSVDLVAGHYVVAGLVGTAARVRVLDRQGALVAEVPLPGRGVVAEQAYSGNYKIFPPMEGGSVVPCGDGFTFTFAAPGSAPATYLFDIPHAPSHPARAAGGRPGRHHGGAARALRARRARGDVHARLAGGRRARTSRGRPSSSATAGSTPRSSRPSSASSPPSWRRAATSSSPISPGEASTARSSGRPAAWPPSRAPSTTSTRSREALVADGVTTPAQLGLVGESNGGVLAAAAVAQRPELWGAVCVQVPLTDMLRAPLDPFGAAVTMEYGDPSSPDDAPRLMAWSPYHNLRETGYPPVLVWTGENDARCAPWHARKFAARLQHVNRCVRARPAARPRRRRPPERRHRPRPGGRVARLPDDRARAAAAGRGAAAGVSGRRAPRERM